MAHHNRTPRSVLNAPTVRRTVISDQSDLNRAERRHLTPAPHPTKPGELVLVAAGKRIPKDQQLPTRNRPYVKGQATTAAVSRRSVRARMAGAVGRVRSTLVGSEA